MDGMIRIGTELDTKPLEKELKEAEKELKQFEKEADKLTAEKIEIEAKVKIADDEYKRQIENLKKSYERSILPAFAGGTPVTEERKLEIARKYEEQLQEINQKYFEQIKPLEDINKKLKENANNQNNWKEKVSETNEELDKIKNQNNLTKGLKQGFESAFKSAKRLALGIIGVRAAYSLIRKAASAYLQTDSQATAQMEANWAGLGAIMSSIIPYITNLLKKAVTAVLQFMSVLTGTDYIGRANEAILRKQTKATNDLTKATDKYTASFDEMNVLNDSSASNDYGADNVMASLFDINDLSENTRKAIENVAEALKPVYEMLKNIVKFGLEHPDIVLGIIGGVGLLSILSKVIGYAGVGTAVGTGLAGVLGVLLAIGSVAIISGSVLDVLTNYAKLVDDEENVVKGMKSNEQQGQKLVKQTKKLAQTNNGYAGSLDKVNHANSVNIKSNLDVIKMYSQEEKAVQNSSLAFTGLPRAIQLTFGPLARHEEAMKIATQESFNFIDAGIEMYKQGKLSEDGINELSNSMLDYVDVIGDGGTSISDLTKKFGLNAKEAEVVQAQYNIVATELYRMYKNGDLTVNILNKMPKNVRTTIENNFDKNLNLLDNVYAMIEKIPGYKRVDVETKVTADTSSAKSTLEKLFSGMKSSLSILDGALGTNFAYKFSQIKLARGGIVNNPGRGVSIGTNIVAGEAGPEAVLPLNEQTMGMLAKLITDKMVVNLTNINQMNGRVISRELQRVQNDSDFAYNR